MRKTDQNGLFLQCRLWHYLVEQSGFSILTLEQRYKDKIRIECTNHFYYEKRITRVRILCISIQVEDRGWETKNTEIRHCLQTRTQVDKKHGFQNICKNEQSVWVHLLSSNYFKNVAMFLRPSDLWELLGQINLMPCLQGKIFDQSEMSVGTRSLWNCRGNCRVQKKFEWQENEFKIWRIQIWNAFSCNSEFLGSSWGRSFSQKIHWDIFPTNITQIVYEKQ